MSRHRLPPATVIDGRCLYTAGDMRAYYDLAISTTHDDGIDPTVTETTPPSSASIDDLMKMFGMTK